MRRSFALAAATVCLAATSACASGTATPLPAASGPEVSGTPRANVSSGTSPRPGSSQTAEPTSPTPEPSAVDANELGMVPVLMYHQIVDNPSNVYERTPEAFRAELERLARAGYVPVTAADYVTGAIDIPAGKHPVVLTFDDSTIDQLAFNSSGEPKLDTAVGILLSVAEDHPSFRPVATFFVNRNPFTLGKRGLRWLHEHGFEIGNHTYDHVNLEEQSANGVQRQIAKLHRMITSAVPDAEVSTLALPLGARPDTLKLAARGSWHGTSYDYDGVFLVGARPAPSPYDTDFDPLEIPRIRSGDLKGPEARWCSTRWLNYLDKHPGERYTSDGDPSRISFPEKKSDQLASDVDATVNPY